MKNEFKFCITYGYFEISSSPFLGSTSTWHPSPNLSLTRDQQLKHNMDNVEGFQEIRIMPPIYTLSYESAKKENGFFDRVKLLICRFLWKKRR